MADTFGIFREDSLPPVLLVKDVPTLIKGKGGVHSTKKKALGDVSNTVTQKAPNTQQFEKSGKPFGDSCSSACQEVYDSCRSVQTKESPDESSNRCTRCSDFAESDYDIVPKSQRPTEKAIDQLTSYNHQPYSPVSIYKTNFDLPDLSLAPSVVFMPENIIPNFDELEESPLADVSFSSLDDSDLSDFSF